MRDKDCEVALDFHITEQSNPFKCIEQTIKEQLNERNVFKDTFELKISEMNLPQLEPETKIKTPEKDLQFTTPKVVKNSFEPCYEKEHNPSMNFICE